MRLFLIKIMLYNTVCMISPCSFHWVSLTYQTENGEYKHSQSIPNQRRGEYK